MRETWRESYSLRLLGMARRANLVVIGQDRLFAAIKRGFTGIVLLAVDANQNMCRKLESKVLTSTGVDLLYTRYERGILGASQGRAELAVLGVKAGAMAQSIRQALSDEQALFL